MNINKFLHRSLYGFHKYLLRSPASEIADSADFSEQRIDAPSVIASQDMFLQWRGVDEAVCHHEWAIPECRVYRFPSAYLVGTSGLVFAPDRRRLQACSKPLLKRQKILRPLSALARRLPRQTAAGEPIEYVHLCGESMKNRVHFLVEHAPRLLTYRRVPTPAGTVRRYIIPPDLPTWFREYLGFLGCEASSLVEGSLGTLYAENVLFTGFPGGDRIRYPEALYRELCDQLYTAGRAYTGLPAAPTANPDGPVVWIERRDAPVRRLENEPALIAAWTQRFGPVETISLSDLPLREQLRTLQSARCIVCLQGQALNLMMFLRGTPIVMLDLGHPSTRDDWNNTFFTLSQVAQCPMLRLFSAIDDPGTWANWTWPSTDFAAQLDELGRAAGDGALDALWGPILAHSSEER